MATKTKTDLIETIGKVDGIGGHAVNKADLASDLSALKGVDETTISKRALFDAIVDLDAFSTRKAAQDVVDVISGLGILTPSVKSKDIVTLLAGKGLLAAQPKASVVVDALIEDIKDNIIAGNSVDISGFVNFKPAVQAAKPARAGINPSTGESMDIPATPAKKVVRTKVTAPFKRAIIAG